MKVYTYCIYILYTLYMGAAACIDERRYVYVYMLKNKKVYEFV